jgi:hypothetical protein
MDGGGDMGDGGDGGGGGAEGGSGGSGGDGGGDGVAAPQLTPTCPTAASPVYEPPRVYSKANEAALTSTLALSHEFPLLPLMLHTGEAPAAVVRRSVPIVLPYMW